MSAQFAILVTVTIAAWPALFGQESALIAKSNTAHQALLDGHYEQAVKLYSDLVTELPDNPGLRLNLGLALEKAKQPAAAIPHLQYVTRAQPDGAPAWFLLGVAYQQLRQPERAIAPLRQAVRLDGSNRQALFELADAELTSGDFPGAARDFERLTRARPEMAQAWQGASLSYSRWSEEIAAQLQRTAPQSGYAKALAAKAQLAMRHFGIALSLYRQALQLLPPTPRLHEACAGIYRQTGHADWAAIEERRERQLVLSGCANQSPGCAYVKRDYKAILESREKNIETSYWQALAVAQLSEECLNRLARLPPSSAQHEVLAEAHQRKGERLEAVVEWRRALALAPADHRLQGRLAESLYRARIYPEAEQRLARLTAAEPENSEWQYLLGSVLLDEELPEEALAPLEKAVRLQPGLLPAENSLGRAYLNTGRAREAIVHLENARPLDDGSLSFALSSAYRKVGRLDDARAALARYRQLKRAESDSGSASREEILTPP